ncbi:hypothetical protein Droror1_Dr00015044 [Drosera rotundifolia]
MLYDDYQKALAWFYYKSENRKQSVNRIGQQGSSSHHNDKYIQIETQKSIQAVNLRISTVNTYFNAAIEMGFEENNKDGDIIWQSQKVGKTDNYHESLQTRRQKQAGRWIPEELSSLAPLIW